MKSTPPPHCYIIAEAGVNHNGDLALAKKLVDAAAAAGVDAVKFQTFKAELIVTSSAAQAAYQRRAAKDTSQQAMLRKLELTPEDFAELKEYCVQRSIEFLSTPHAGAWSLQVLEKLDLPFYKIGSGDLTNLPFLRAVAATGKPIVLSTGMATIEEIKEAVTTLRAGGCEELTVLQCTTLYPCPDEKANIRAMHAIQEATACPVGYSDHTQGIEAGVIAACLGASVIEKHFTLDRKLPGPDHAASIEPDELATLASAIRAVTSRQLSDPIHAFAELNALGYQLDARRIPALLGDGTKKPVDGEEELRTVARKSIIARTAIRQGERFSEDKLLIKRPGNGLAPKFLDELLGRRARRAYAADELIDEDEVKP